MKKELSPIEELRKKIDEEKIQERIKKENSRPKPPTDEQIKSFINEIFVSTFETIQKELKGYVKKTRFRTSKRGIRFYVTERSTNVYSCYLELRPAKNVLYYSAEYSYIPENAPKNPPPVKSSTGLDIQKLEFASLIEITPERIIAMFNRSFFLRLKQIEKDQERRAFRLEDYNSDEEISWDE